MLLAAKGSSPISFIENDNFVARLWQCQLLLSEHLDFVTDNIDTSMNTTIITHQLLFSISQRCKPLTIIDD